MIAGYRSDELLIIYQSRSSSTLQSQSKLMLHNEFNIFPPQQIVV